MSGDPEPATVRALELDVLEHLRAQLHDCEEIAGPDGSIWFIPGAPLASIQGATTHKRPTPSRNKLLPQLGDLVGFWGLFPEGVDSEQPCNRAKPI